MKSTCRRWDDRRMRLRSGCSTLKIRGSSTHSFKLPNSLAGRPKTKPTRQLFRIIVVEPLFNALTLSTKVSSSASRALCGRYPQLSESHFRSEIDRMSSWGVDVEVWIEQTGTGSPYESSMTLHTERLKDVITSVQPDINSCPLAAHRKSLCLHRC